MDQLTIKEIMEWVDRVFELGIHCADNFPAGHVRRVEARKEYKKAMEEDLLMRIEIRLKTNGAINFEPNDPSYEKHNI